MEFENHTPFQPIHFQTRDRELTDHGVVVLRGTFDIRPGDVLRPREKQSPIVLADEYVGVPGQSSLKQESSLAPFKPRTDVVLRAHAHSPTGRPQAAWDCAVALDGRFVSRFSVTGPRAFQVRSRVSRRHVLEECSPTAQVDVSFENSFGGIARDERGAELPWLENPVGKGYVGVERAERIEAPQVLPYGLRELALGRSIQTVGIGPVAPTWAPRIQHVGTYDGIWQRTRFPDLPADFDYRFYNTGAPGLTLPRYARGNEWIGLVNLGRRGPLDFRLPGYQLFTVMHLDRGRPLPGPCMLDTIEVDADQLVVHLTWRAIVPAERLLDAVHVRLRTHSGASRAPHQYASVG